MSAIPANFDRPLDDIVMEDAGNLKKGRKGRRGANRGEKKAPVGGVQKPQTRGAVRGARGGRDGARGGRAAAAPAAAASTPKGDTILVSGLPRDIDEKQLQEYFQRALGSRPKKVVVQYDKFGKSNGSATVTLQNATLAEKTIKILDDVKIDGRALSVKIIVDPNASAPKTLADRITTGKATGKNQPKSATQPKSAVPKTNPRGRARRENNGEKRTKKVIKSQEDMDTEMAEYLKGAGAPEIKDTAKPNGGEVDMEENL